MKRSLTLLALLAMLAVAACGGDPQTTTGAATTGAKPQTFVGEVDGTGAYIALIADGSQLQGYVCDGEEAATWFDAVGLSEGKGPLLSRDGEELGTATLIGTQATGEVTIDDESYTFTAEEATSDDAGLFRQAVGEPGQPGFEETGWIVLDDGSIRGNRTSIDSSGDPVVGPAPSKPSGKVTEFINPTTQL